MIPNDRLSQLTNLDLLKAGDVLLFLPWYKKIPFINRVLMFLQSIFYEKEGYFTVTHAALYSGKCEDGKHKISHVSESGFKFRTDTLEELEKEVGEKRPFIIFRAKDASFSEKIYSISEEFERNYPPIHWSLKSALKTLFVKSKRKRNDSIEKKIITENTHCSKFVVECIKNASAELGIPSLSVRSTISPAGLYKALHEDNRFSMQVYTAEIDVLGELLKLIHSNMERIKKRVDYESNYKYLKCHERLSCILKNIKLLEGRNDLEKAYHLYIGMKEVLSIQTGFKFRKETTSTAQVKAFAHRVGLFSMTTIETVAKMNNAVSSKRSFAR